MARHRATKGYESKELAITDLSTLKRNIETDIGKLAETLKTKIVPGQDVEVVFSLTDFFLLEPKDK